MTDAEYKAEAHWIINKTNPHSALDPLFYLFELGRLGRGLLNDLEYFTREADFIPGPGTVGGTFRKIGTVYLKGTTSYTRVGRWMSKVELEAMQKTGKVVEGGGYQTFISTNGWEDYIKATGMGNVYVEFDVPTNSLLQGGKDGWFKMISPNASTSQKYLLKKQGGEFLPEVENLSPILKIKE